MSSTVLIIGHFIQNWYHIRNEACLCEEMFYYIVSILCDVVCFNSFEQFSSIVEIQLQPKVS